MWRLHPGARGGRPNVNFNPGRMVESEGFFVPPKAPRFSYDRTCFSVLGEMFLNHEGDMNVFLKTEVLKAFRLGCDIGGAIWS